MKTFEVRCRGTLFGVYNAESAQAARDLCAQDAGYQSEAEMQQPSELEVSNVWNRPFVSVNINQDVR